MSHKTAATVAHTIGFDTGKNTLYLIGLDDKGAIVLREKISRGRIRARLANVPRCLIGIEAGMATHFAHAIAEAVQRPSTRFGGATIEENTELGFSGLCWGPDFESRFAGDTNSSAIEQIDELMPPDGDVRDAETAPIFQHVVNRVTELTAGSEGEKLAFGDAWTAADDRAQERKLASLIYSSPEAAEAFIAACALEARAILRRHADSRRNAEERRAAVRLARRQYAMAAQAAHIQQREPCVGADGAILQEGSLG
jgi:hypothetical protein